MRSQFPVSWSIAALSTVFLMPGLVHSQSTMNARSPQSTTAATSGQQEAMQMVPARAYLNQKLDAKDQKQGQEFRATLSDTVKLKDGPKLPHGTVLIGTIANDDTQTSGNAKLALRFTKADLKGGKEIPIKAMIVAVYPPESSTDQGQDIVPGQEAENTWNNQMLQIDQVNAVSGVDLHSRINGQNSGLFVTSKKDDVKIAAQSELALAIASAGGSQSRASNSSGRTSN